MLTPVPEQDTGHLDQPQVVSGLLLVAHQDGPALAEPTQGGAFHHNPPASRVAFEARIVELLLADVSDVGKT